MTSRRSPKNGSLRGWSIAAFVAICIVPQAVHAQSLTDRFKNLFGGSSSAPPPQTSAPAQAPSGALESCPPVQIRAGASTYAVALPGKQAVGADLRFQATIIRTVRECFLNAGEVTGRIGIQGRIIVGPAGAPESVQIPLRIAVVQGGVSEKTVATKAYTTAVAVSEEGNNVFSFVADDVTYPNPPANVADEYIYYIGFDPQALKPEPKARVKPKKGSPEAKR